MRIGGEWAHPVLSGKCSLKCMFVCIVIQLCFGISCFSITCISVQLSKRKINPDLAVPLKLALTSAAFALVCLIVTVCCLLPDISSIAVHS